MVDLLGCDITSIALCTIIAQYASIASIPLFYAWFTVLFLCVFILSYFTRGILTTLCSQFVRKIYRILEMNYIRKPILNQIYPSGSEARRQYCVSVVLKPFTACCLWVNTVVISGFTEQYWPALYWLVHEVFSPIFCLIKSNSTVWNWSSRMKSRICCSLAPSAAVVYGSIR